ncbi:MAG: hypothetical protein WBC18_15415, partial [Ottowia sp.]|uniref:hypothetical protein n=1 Tax=Ottowia sp. TaxID=1898956 RepID=UPI003C73ECDE
PSKPPVIQVTGGFVFGDSPKLKTRHTSERRYPDSVSITNAAASRMTGKRTQQSRGFSQQTPRKLP